MEYKFSDRVLTLKPSAIREIFKYAADPSYVSLSAGNPAPEAFPSKQLAAISAKLMEEEPILALQYSTTEGYPPLLQHLKAYMKSSRNIGTEDDGVLVTSGAQQIMDLFTKSILNEGETVICEAPLFKRLPFLQSKARRHPDGHGRHEHGSAGKGARDRKECEVHLYDSKLSKPLRHHDEP